MCLSICLSGQFPGTAWTFVFLFFFFVGFFFLCLLNCLVLCFFFFCWVLFFVSVKLLGPFFFFFFLMGFVFCDSYYSTGALCTRFTLISIKLCKVTPPRIELNFHLVQPGLGLYFGIAITSGLFPTLCMCANYHSIFLQFKIIKGNNSILNCRIIINHKELF